MLVLFPSDPFDTWKPDADWAEESRIAQECGHEVAYVHHESLVNDDDPAAAVKKVPLQEDTAPALYRGWMLTTGQYEKLHDALMRECGVELITNPRQYAFAQNLAEWYPRLEGGTPRTVAMPLHRVTLESVTEKAVGLLMECEHGIVIKDYVKSRKHEWEDACFIPNGEEAKRVVGNFLERQGSDLQGGVVLREFVPLKPLGAHPKSGMPMSEEYRFFWLNGHVACLSEYWPADAYETETLEVPEPEGGWPEELEGVEKTMTVPKGLEELPPFEELAGVAARIGVPFFTMDLALAANGEWTVMEIGDGQVSGFPQMPTDAQKFYPALEPFLKHEHDHPHEEGPPPLTRTEMDPMTCAAPGCDHTSHGGGMVMHPRCHVGTPTWCAYADGVLTVSCAECDKVVARVAVAPGEPVRH